ncbi:olfactory receptor 14A16-like [Mycteria americana]|uniref:olfactory receptor 14A16-like n=1 Tax=Mycteria americana TaxID=33587 RepID=UPI003F58112A
MSNSSSITQFLLLAFMDTRKELQLLYFWLFLGIYLAALLGNGLIITAVACDHRLHTPMYFFLLNLSLLDLGSISTTVPKSMANTLWDTRAISYLGCATQVFFFLLFLSAECCLLTIMAYDRYVAICKPLHYGTLLGSRACLNMAAAAWGSGLLYAVLHTANTFALPLCHGNALDQFFCEIPQILKLSCSQSYLREVGLIVVSTFSFFVCFVFIVLSYVQIFRAVLRIPSEQGRHKAFSTCLPHLAVVSLFLSTGTFAYLKPPSISSPSLDVVVAILYAVVPPTVNPLIYSMRNKDLKDALWQLVTSLTIEMLRISNFEEDSPVAHAQMQQLSNSSSITQFLLLVAISYTGCAAQVFMFAFFITAEFSLLTIMAYDRYMAICQPLRYGTLLDSREMLYASSSVKSP